jgi:two-component system LytT family response regulator
VDDELPARQRLSDLLRKEPCVQAVSEAQDGRAAVEAIRSEPPDLVFLDVQMPEITGLDVIEQIGPRNMPVFGNGVLTMIASARGGSRHLDRLAVKSGGNTQFIRVAEIDWIEAAGVYVNLHIRSKAILHRMPLAELLGHLDPAKFVRVHRSAAVNIDSILRLEPMSHGEFEIVLKNESRTRVSRTYRAALEAALGQSL